MSATPSARLRALLPVRMRALLSRADGVTRAVLVVLAGALAMRLYELGAKAMHHDESLHATFSWYFAQGQGYAHDPLMHGPLQFHATAGLFLLLGDGEFTARLPAALAGTALVATPLLFRRVLGGSGVIAAALLLALSPSLLYYSRFARADLPAALWSVLLVAAVWRYRTEGGCRWLVMLAAALALAFATKETAYLTAAVLLLYVNAALTARLLAGRDGTRLRRAIEAAALFPVAWLFAALWGRSHGVRRRLGLHFAAGAAGPSEKAPPPREAELLVVLGTLVLPLLAAFVQLPLGAAAPVDEHTLGLVTAGVLMAAAAAVGLSWGGLRWLWLAAIFAAITVPLYTTGFSNLDGAAGAVWSSLDYWLEQQGVRRGNQPAFYYLMMLPLYEFLVLIPALTGAIWLWRRGDRLTILLGWWGLGTLLALSVAGEKMPWLLVHLALPLALLAGRVVGAALPAAAGTLRRRTRGGRALLAWGGAGGVMTSALLLSALSLRAAVAVAYGHPDTPIEPLIYTQTGPAVPALAREIEAFSNRERGPGRAQPIVVETTLSLSWPWAWYLRDFSSVSYLPSESLSPGALPDGAVLIVTAETLRAAPELREGFPAARPYAHRRWFPEDGYRAASPGSLARSLIDGSLFGRWSLLLGDGAAEQTLGSLDAVVLFPEATTAP